MSTFSSTRGFHPVDHEQQIDIAARVCAMQFETSQIEELARSRLLGCRLGGLSLVQYESHGIEHGVRTLEHIRANPEDYFLLCLPLQAHFQFAHVGRTADVPAGAGVILTSQQPFEAYVRSDEPGGRHSSLQVRIPGAVLRQRLPSVDHLCNRPFAVDSGAGRILQNLVQTTLTECVRISEEQAPHLGRALADLVACSVQERGGRVLSVPRTSPADAIFERAMAFIESRISSPDLDAPAVARHCRVSTRYLQMAFRQRSMSVARSIREMRLNGCKVALGDPALSSRSVIEIASRWGFSDPSHFGRVYRQRFGRAPSSERPRSSSQVEADA